MSVLIEHAQQALTQAEAMNSAAKENDWDKVREIQALHNELVSKIAIAEVNPQRADELRKILIEVRRLNGETEALASETKKELVKEKKTLNQANKMQKALLGLK